VRRSVLPHSKADLLLFGNAERALVELAHRLAKGEPIESIRDLRGTAFMVPPRLAAGPDWARGRLDDGGYAGRVHAHPDPYAMEPTPQAGSPRWRRAVVRVVSRAERLAQRRRARQTP
jgi:radical SAM superfamily enzyme YgiQ (UPF0313 family)